MTTNTTRETEAAARRAPPRALLLAAAAGLALSAAAPPAARAAIEDSYSPGEPPVATTWFGPASATARRTDQEYVAGMRPHHAGALSMSRDYLADPARSSPLLQALARAIVANQTFEIAMLDEVGRNLEQPPVRLPFGLALQPQATEGLAGTQRFFKEPIPSAATYAVGPVSERDVQFAKAMIIHHQAAVDMARGYLADRDARNGYLGLMNVDIVTDQTQEIALLRNAIAAYPGDADAVRVDPSMVHGMDGMKHGAHGGGGGHAATAPGGGHAHSHGADHAAHGRHEDHHRAQHGGNAGHAGHGGHHHGAGAAPAGAPDAPAAKPRQAQRPRPAAAQREDGHAAGHGGGQHGGHHHHHGQHH